MARLTPRATAVVFLLLLHSTPAAQPPPYRTGIDLVLVDLTVLDRKDAPVPDLGDRDLDLLVDGQPRPIRWLTFVSAARAARPSDRTAPASPPAGELRRTLVIVVDRESIAAGEGQQVLSAAAGFLDRLPPDDRLALATLPEPGERLRFEEPRSELAARLRKAIGTWRAEPSAYRIFPWEAFEIVRRNKEVLNLVAERECLRFARKDAGRWATCLAQLEFEARLVADARKRDVETTMRALRRLFVELGRLEGPKHVVLVAGGLTESIESLQSLGDIAAAAAANRVRVHVLQVTPNPDWVPVEERGVLSRPSFTPTSTSAINLATATGGLALAPVAGGAFFDRLEKHLASEYLLAFDPLPSDRDGKPHRIEVRVTSGRNLTVRARREFVVPPLMSTRAAPPAPPIAPGPEAAAAPPSPPATTGATPSRAAEAAVGRPAPRPARDAVVDEAVRKMAAYVAAYGADAALFVGAERYDQRVELGQGTLRPHVLESEFAIVRTSDAVGWAGYRDVVEADGEQVADRRDRLQALLTGSADPRAEVRRIADESARYNVGPVMRNFNVPTTTLFFFHPSRVGRFAFKSRGTKKVDDTPVLMLDFVEVARPTLAMKRDGTDVPAEGSVWIVPEDGTVVRTRVRLRGFADSVHMGLSASDGPPRSGGPVSVAAPAVYSPPPQAASAPQSTGSGGGASGSGSGSGGGSASGSGGGSGQGAARGQSGGGGSAPQPVAQPVMEPPSFPTMERIESRADVEVTYRRDGRFGVWLPAKMSEIYEGPIYRRGKTPILGRATAVAKYTGYRRFETSATIVPPK